MKSTVILVHGTFAAPEMGANWYQQQMETTASPNFVARLDAELARRGAVARCWAHLPEGEAVFHWSGNNSWTDRALAARSLADYVDELHREGWKCHIVAHSHGGNLAVEALPRIKARKSVASVVTMGTPFLCEFDYISRSQRITEIVGQLIIRAVVSLFFVLSGLVLVFAAYRLLIENYRNATSLVGLLLFVSWFGGLGGLAVYLPIPLLIDVFKNKKTFDWAALSRPNGPFILDLSSKFDEAWQLLHHLHSTQNPFQLRSYLGYIWEQRRAYVSRGLSFSSMLHAGSFSNQRTRVKVSIIIAQVALVCLIAAVALDYANVGVDQQILNYAFLFSFLTFVIGFVATASEAPGHSTREQISALWSPWRLGWIVLTSLPGIMMDTVRFFVRRNIWPTLQEICFGQAGFRRAARRIEQRPPYLPEGMAVFENLPEQIETSALERRGAWLRQKNRDVGETFAKYDLTTLDVRELAKRIEIDLT